MNKLTVRVHTPGGVGEATLTRADILDSKWLSVAQKNMLLDKFVPESDALVYNGDIYYKIASAKTIETTKSNLYYSPTKNKYLNTEEKYKGSSLEDKYGFRGVIENSTDIQLW